MTPDPTPPDQLPPSARRVADALAAAGAGGRVVILEDSARTASEAAAALGCDVGAIAKGLVFLADGEPVLVMTSGRHRVDTDLVAGLLGAARVERASADDVRTATGQAIGGVAPVGHPAPVRTLVDRSLADHPTVWAAGGTPHAIFPTTFDELVRITDGQPGVVAQQQPPT